MTNQCKGCIHRPICEWCHENSAFKFPEREGGCDLYYPDEERREARRVTRVDLKTYKKMERSAGIGLIAYAAVMIIYSFATQKLLDSPATTTVLDSKIWFVGWIAMMVGWAFMVPNLSALRRALRDTINEGATDDEEREQ